MSNTENCTMHLSYRLCKKNKYIPEAQFVWRAVMQKKEEEEKEQAVGTELQIHFIERSCNRDETWIAWIFAFWIFGNMLPLIGTEDHQRKSELPWLSLMLIRAENT